MECGIRFLTDYLSGDVNILKLNVRNNKPGPLLPYAQDFTPGRNGALRRRMDENEGHDRY